MLHIIAEYAAIAGVFAALAGLGTLPELLIAGIRQPSPLLRLPLLVMAGWGLVALLSAIGAVACVDQTWFMCGSLLLGWLCLLPFSRRVRAKQLVLLGDIALLAIFVAPMGLLVSGTPAMAFDEFAQWLPNARNLVEHAHYWNWPDWVGLSSKPGYPNASAVIALLASQFVGPDVEAQFKTFVVMLLGAYGAALASLAAICWRTGRPATIALLGAGCLFALVDPFMDPRICFTAYTDAPSAIVLAVAVLTVAYGVTAAARGQHRAAGSWFAWAGFLSLTLILLRQTNLVLVAAMDGGAGLLLLILHAGSARLWLRWALWLIAPPAVGHLVWQAHLWAARIGPDITPRPLALWDWAAPLIVLRALVLDRLAGNPLVGGAALLLAVLAIVGGIVVWHRLAADGDDDLPSPGITVALSAIVALCFVAFLAWAYIAVFSAAEVEAAASLWRYVGELVPMLIVAGCVIALRLAPAPRVTGGIALVAAMLAMTLLTLLPYLGRGYYRLDCRYPDVAASRAAIAELRPVLNRFAAPADRPARVAVVNPTMGDWMAYALAYDMHWPAAGAIVRFRTGNEKLAAIEDWAWDQGLDALLDLTPLDRATMRMQHTVPAVSLLGRPAAKGEPWPVLATTQPRPLPACVAWGRLTIRYTSRALLP